MYHLLMKKCGMNEKASRPLFFCLPTFLQAACFWCHWKTIFEFKFEIINAWKVLHKKKFKKKSQHTRLLPVFVLTTKERKQQKILRIFTTCINAKKFSIKWASFRKKQFFQHIVGMALWARSIFSPLVKNGTFFLAIYAIDGVQYKRLSLF